MHFKSLITLALTFSSLTVLGAVERQLFTMEKNYNAENIMIIHTQTDQDCRFVTSPKNNEKNYLEFYWLMDGKSKKEVHSMIRAEIKNRVQFQGINSTRDSFKVKLNDLSELRHDLTDTTMEVVSEMIQGECTVKSILTLGASAKYRKMDLKRTYCSVTKNLIGVPNGCSYLLLEGIDIATGEKFSVKFNKR